MDYSHTFYAPICYAQHSLQGGGGYLHTPCPTVYPDVCLVLTLAHHWWP